MLIMFGLLEYLCMIQPPASWAGTLPVATDLDFSVPPRCRDRECRCVMKNGGDFW